MNTESVLYAGIRIALPPLPSFSPVRTNQHWPRDGWKGIIYQVCLEHRVKIAEVMSNSRQRHIVACRWEIIRRMRATPGHNGKPVSLPIIGRRLGIDHSSVLYALKRLDGVSPRDARLHISRYDDGARHRRNKRGMES